MLKTKQKDLLDKFYTKPEIASFLVKELKNIVDLSSYDLILEPSAGKGAFSTLFKDTKNLVALDILPENNDILEMDFLTYEPPPEKKKILLIGNPPFGQRNQLTKKFLKHAQTFSGLDTIAFILPNVFKKETNQNQLDKQFKLIKIIPLPENSFVFNDQPYHVECSFFVFSKNSAYPDLRTKLISHTKDFTIVDKDQEYDFFTFGSAPHKLIIYPDTPNKNNRGYYIKCSCTDNKKNIIERFKSLKWKGHSSVSGGVWWLTKNELLDFWEKNK
jgi:hypothetical protein